MIALFWGVLCLLLFAPGLKVAPRIVLLAALLYGLNELAVVNPIWWSNQFGLQYNWLGKLLAILLVLLVIYQLRERSGSTWAALATHNLTNVCLSLGQAMP